MASALAIRTCLSVTFFSFVLGINHFIFADSLKLCQISLLLMGKIEEVVDNEFLKWCGVPNDQHA